MPTKKKKSHHKPVSNTNPPSSKPTITDIMKLAAKLSQEEGRYVSYGEVQAAIQTGKIKL